jgi:hypothetical protein
LKEIFSSPKSLDRIWNPSTFFTMGTGGYTYMGIKKERREADHSLSSNAEQRNCGATLQFPLMPS